MSLYESITCHGALIRIVLRNNETALYAIQDMIRAIRKCTPEASRQTFHRLVKRVPNFEERVVYVRLKNVSKETAMVALKESKIVFRHFRKSMLKPVFETLHEFEKNLKKTMDESTNETKKTMDESACSSTSMNERANKEPIIDNWEDWLNYS